MGKNRRKSAGKGEWTEPVNPYDYDEIDEINDKTINKALNEQSWENIEMDAIGYEASGARFIITDIDDTATGEEIKLVNPRADYQKVSIDRAANRILALNRMEGNGSLSTLLSKIEEHIGQHVREVKIGFDPAEELGQGAIYNDGADIHINSVYLDGMSDAKIEELMDMYFSEYI